MPRGAEQALWGYAEVALVPSCSWEHAAFPLVGSKEQGDQPSAHSFTAVTNGLIESLEALMETVSTKLAVTMKMVEIQCVQFAGL